MIFIKPRWVFGPLVHFQARVFTFHTYIEALLWVSGSFVYSEFILIQDGQVFFGYAIKIGKRVRYCIY